MHELTRELHVKNDTKIVMFVADGLGGLPLQPGGKTELETANTPNLDALAKPASWAAAFRSARHQPRQRAGPPGPVRLRSAAIRDRPRRAGSDRHRLRLQDGDVAVRGNFCTLDAEGNITDRRAGRIASEESAPLADQAAQREDSRRRSLRRAGEGTSLRRRVSRPGPATATCTTPIRKPPACRRSTRSRPTPTARRRPKSPTSSSPGPRAAGRRDEGQRPDAARLRRQAEAAELRRSVRPARRPRSPSIRCTRAWPGWSAWTSSARPRRSPSR